MNLIYIRPAAPKARKFIKAKLRGADASSIYSIEAGDCCLAPVPLKRGGYMLTFLNDISQEMLGFIYRSAAGARLNQN
ncbi:MAG TPA: hypothetical protein PKI19_13935 [Elusimicrobiales bacterium]|nr:hypothetical protein [Elusimicrobiales bacterium]